MQANSFTGIHNTTTARSIPDNALADAVDVDLTDSGDVLGRLRHALVLPMPITAAYMTADLDVYLVSDGELIRLLPDLSTITICNTTATAFADEQRYLFTNDGFMVFDDKAISLKVPAPSAPIVSFTRGEDKFVAVATNIVNGLEGPASDIVEFYSNGEFTTDAYVASGEVFRRGDEELPPECLQATGTFPDHAEQIAIFDSRLFVSEYADKHTVIWFSLRNTWHLFDQASDYFIIPGKVSAMLGNSSHLVLVTDKEIYAYDKSSLIRLANYGCPEGTSLARHPSMDAIYIHSNRGTCTFPPFTNRTDKKLALAPGDTCSTSFVHQRGMQQFVALHDGNGKPFNKY